MTLGSRSCSRVFRGVLVGLTAAAALVLVACGDDGGGGYRPGAGSPGGLGQANLFPECGALNQACLQYGLDSPLAAGSVVELGVNYKINGSSGPPTSFQTTNSGVLEMDRALLRAKTPGAAGVLLIGPNEQVVDFLHVWVAPTEELRVFRYTDAGLVVGQMRDSGTVLVGDELIVSVEPYGNAQPLLGHFDVTWSVDGDPDAVVVIHDTVIGWYRIVARNPGNATITADALGTQKTIALEVLP